jgi:hypothetical protein
MSILKNIRSVSCILSFVSILSIFIFVRYVSASNIIEISPDQLITYDGTDKIELSITLLLTDKFRNYTWDAPTGRPYTLVLGDSLSKNAEILCKKVFQKVTLSKGTEDNISGDVVLTPEVVFLDKTQAAFSSQMVEMEIRVLWTLTNARGKIAWIDTIKGFGHEKMGGPFSFDKNTKKQIRMAMGDMFKNTYNKLFIAAQYFIKNLY